MPVQPRAEANPPHRPERRPRHTQRGTRGSGQARDSTAVGYLRRSTDRQEQSIPDQKRAVEAYCAERGLDLVDWYVDDAISGTSSLARKAFQQLIADAQSRSCAFGAVVCYDVKRFGRVDNDEAGYYRHLLRTHGVEVHYASENFSGDYTDDLLRPVKQWQARQESKDLSKVTIRGLLSRVGGGWWMGGVPPHGYDLRYENERGEFLFVLRHMPDGSKQVLDQRQRLVRTLARGESLSISKRDRAKLVPGDPARVETIRWIFSMYVSEHRGLKAISDALNRSDTPTPRGPAWSHIYAGLWRDSCVRAILVNPIYCGDMVWNRRTDARFHMIVGGKDGRAVERRQAHGARLVPNDESDWIIVPNTHEGLVSRKLFDQARAIRSGRPASSLQEGRPKPPQGGWTGARSRFILSGLVRCGRCGGRYQGVTRQKGKPRLDGTKVRTFSYACGNYIARGTSACEYGPVSQERLESAVKTAILEHYGRYLQPGGRELLTAHVRKSLGKEATDLADARARLEADRRRIETSIANLLDNITAANRDLADGRLLELRKERQSLERRTAELDRVAAEEQDLQDTVRQNLAWAAGLEFVLRHGANQEQQQVVRQCVQSISIDASNTSGTLVLLRTPMSAAFGNVEVLVAL